MLFHYPVLNMTGLSFYFTYQNSILCKLYALQNEVYQDLN